MSEIKRYFLSIAMAFFLVGTVQANNADELFESGYKAFVKRDYIGAERHWKLASKQDHARAQNGLGVLYRDGDLGEIRLEDAALWFTKSANNGYAFAMFNLGMLYKNGVSRGASDIAAYRWLLLANTVNFDENAKFLADLLSQRMDRTSIMTAREQAQLWIDEFFYGVSN